MNQDDLDEEYEHFLKCNGAKVMTIDIQIKKTCLEPVYKSAFNAFRKAIRALIFE